MLLPAGALPPSSYGSVGGYGRVSGLHRGTGFRYNGRVAVALVPALVALAGQHGSSFASVLLVGLLASYALEALSFNQGSLAAAWISLGSAFLAALGGPSLSSPSVPLSQALLELGATAGTLAAAGLWLSLQYEHVSVLHPAVGSLFERIVLGAAPPLALSVLLWSLLEALGAEAAAYYCLALAVFFHALFGRPLPPSFDLGGGADWGGVGSRSAVSPDSAAALFLLALCLPCSLWVAAALGGGLDSWPAAASALLLLSGAGGALALVPGALWWVPGALEGPSEASKAPLSARARAAAEGLVTTCRAGILALSALLFVPGLLGRVVLASYGAYLPLPAPWSWLALGGLLYALAGLLALRSADALHGPFARAATSAALVGAAGGAGAAAGMPLLWLLAPLAAGAGAALLLEQSSERAWAHARRKEDGFWKGAARGFDSSDAGPPPGPLRPDALALAISGTVLSTAWFVHRHFWFLRVDLDGVPLQLFLGLVLLALGVSMAAAALAHQARVERGEGSEAPRGTMQGHASKKDEDRGRSAADLSRLPVRVGASMLLLLQAALCVFAEETLFAGDHRSVTHDAGVMYPAFLVAGTSAAGAAAAWKLGGDWGRGVPGLGPSPLLGSATPWLLLCAYAAKAFLLLLPRTRLVLPALALLLGLTPPLAFAPRPPAPLLALWALGVPLAVGLARFALFDLLVEWGGRRPSEALLLGSLLLAAGAGWLAGLRAWGAAGQARLSDQAAPKPKQRTPVAQPGPTERRARAALLLLLSLAALLCLLRPPLPLEGGARCPRLPLALCPRLWDERHAPRRESDDAAMYGDGYRRPSHWGLWLLVAAGECLVGAWAASAWSEAPPPRAAGKAPPPLGPSPRALVALAAWAAAAALAALYVAWELFPAAAILLRLAVAGSVVGAAAALALCQRPAAPPPAPAGNALPAAAALCASCLALAAAAAAWGPAAPPARRLPLSAQEDVRALARALQLAGVLALGAGEALLLGLALRLRWDRQVRAEGDRGGAARARSGAYSAAFLGSGARDRDGASPLAAQLALLTNLAACAAAAALLWLGAARGGGWARAAAPAACALLLLAGVESRRRYLAALALGGGLVVLSTLLQWVAEMGASPGGWAAPVALEAAALGLAAPAWAACLIWLARDRRARGGGAPVARQMAAALAAGAAAGGALLMAQDVQLRSLACALLLVCAWRASGAHASATWAASVL